MASRSSRCARDSGVRSAVALTPTTLGPSLGVSADTIPAEILDGGQFIRGPHYWAFQEEAAAYLGDHGWQLSRQSVQELFAANGLPPIEVEEEANFGELQYVSGVLKDAQR